MRLVPLLVLGLVLAPAGLLAPAAARAGELWTDLRQAAAIFASDLGYIASAPGRLGGDDALQLAAVAASTGALYAADDEVYDLFRRNRNEGLFDTWREAADAIRPAGHMGKTNPYLLGALVASYAAGLDEVATVSAQILESQAIAGLGKNLANELVRRRRPYEDLGPYAYGDDGSSFPSGHAQNIVQAAVIISHHSPWPALDVAVWTAAISISLQRITSSAHWPSDVWLSGVYGYAVASALMRRYDERRLGSPAPVPSATPRPAPPLSWASRLRWAPVLGDGRVGAAVEVGF